ncbi:MAG TPA: hypothetical protein VKW06_22235 [Candidatus Angelobacter sp.]|nr:hypothetical protein [Candidatus Angelobacter sp.]
MYSAVRTFFLAACLVVAVQPQSPAPAPTDPQGSSKIEAVGPLVKKQFGPGFTVTSKMQTALIVADFDGDGVDDVAIVADSKDPLPDSYDFKYEVSDPYYTYFGFGNPRATAGFGRADPEHNHDLLVIFGAGADAWRAATPKAKFVLINVPFDTIEVGRMLVKKNKPPIFVIRVQESQLMDSNVFWDAKKKRWKWQPGDTLE